MRVITLAGILLAAGCGLVGPDEERRVGVIIGWSTGEPQVEVPDTVDRGVAFPVRMTTVGTGCDRKAATELEMGSAVATVTPYDRVYTGDNACPDAAWMFTHEAMVRFDAAGPAHVVVRGRRDSSGPVQELEREVVVR